METPPWKSWLRPWWCTQNVWMHEWGEREREREPLTKQVLFRYCCSLSGWCTQNVWASEERDTLAHLNFARSTRVACSLPYGWIHTFGKTIVCIEWLLDKDKNISLLYTVGLPLSDTFLLNSTVIGCLYAVMEWMYRRTFSASSMFQFDAHGRWPDFCDVT